MKKNKVIYWISTGVIVAIMLWSAINFAFNAEMKGAFAHLGLPDWFRLELTAAKFLGVLALIIPGIPHKLKEFAYFAFAIVLLSTPVAHLSSGDNVLLEIAHGFFFVCLVISYVYYYRVNDMKLELGKIEKASQMIFIYGFPCGFLWSFA